VNTTKLDLEYDKLNIINSLGYTTIQACDEEHKLCDEWDSKIETMSKAVAIKRGEIYSIMKTELGSNIAVAKHYGIGEASVRRYKDIYNGRDVLNSSHVANDASLRTMLSIIKPKNKQSTTTKEKTIDIYITSLEVEITKYKGKNKQLKAKIKILDNKLNESLKTIDILTGSTKSINHKDLILKAVKKAGSQVSLSQILDCSSKTISGWLSNQAKTPQGAMLVAMNNYLKDNYN
jgi:hypothetical protein